MNPGMNPDILVPKCGPKIFSLKTQSSPKKTVVDKNAWKYHCICTNKKLKL